MKKLATRGDLVYKIHVPILILLLLVTPYFSNYLQNIYYSCWLFLLGLIIIFFRKSSYQTLAGQRKKPFYLWFILILLIGLSSTGSFIGTYYITHQLVTVITPEHTKSLGNTFDQLFYFGLFPWPMILFFAAKYAKHSYIDQKDTYFIDFLNPIIKQSANNSVGMVINAYVKHAVLIWLAAIITFSILTLYYALAVSNKVPVVRGPNFATIISMAALISLLKIKAFNQQLRKVFQRKIPLWLSMLGLLFVTSIALISVTTFFYSLSAAHMEDPATIYQWLKSANWEVYWTLFIGLWWLLGTIPIALFIAHISQGYKIWQMILVGLITPTIVFVVHFVDQFSQTQIALPPAAIIILSLISSIILLICFLNWNNIAIYSTHYLPKADKAKHRNPQKWLRQMVSYIISTIYLYLPGGMVAYTFTFSCWVSFALLTVFVLAFINDLRAP